MDAPSLGSLLRSWRLRIRPVDIGLPFGPAARRTPGLRREEVAWVAGVSADYLKRLEQGRGRPSAAVLQALSRALRLSEPEFQLACRLAGHADTVSGCVPQFVGPSVHRLLDRFAGTPIAVFDATWTLLEHNATWLNLTGELAHRGARETNLVWRAFHGDESRMIHPSPAEHRASLVADLRDAAARYPADRGLAALITALHGTGPEFTHLWTAAPVAHPGGGRKTIVHPEVGPIRLDCDILTVHGADLRIIVFTAEPGSEEAEKLELVDVFGVQEMSTRPRSGISRIPSTARDQAGSPGFSADHR